MTAALVTAGLVAAFLLYALVVRWTGPNPAPIGRPDGTGGDIIQVDVRNGCGVTGLAGQMTAYLRESGFDVVDAGDHVHFDEARSYIVDRVGNPAAARALARATGVPEDRIRTDIRDDYFLDATIVIGADFQTLYPFRSEIEQ